MKFTSNMLWYLQIFLILDSFSYALTDSNIIVERWVNASDVIKKIPFATMTSCYMDCLGTSSCKTIGFDQNPERVKNTYCIQLKTIGETKRSSNMEHMFLLLQVSEENTSKSCNTSRTSKTTNQNKDIWKRINIIDKQTAIKRNNLITTLEKLTPQYVIYLEFKPTTYDGYTYRYVNVLLFSQKVDRWTYGSRLPLICYDKQTKGNFFVATAVNGQWNYHQYTTKAYPVNTWISVKISQLKQNGVYNYSFSVNNKLIHSVINNKPESFDNVQVFVADDENPSQPGYVRKLWVDVESS